ncbi:hypothetical protein Tco_0934366, partial [Tanacetum coccineum]
NFGVRDDRCYNEVLNGSKQPVKKKGKWANDKEYDYEDKTNSNGTRVIEVVDDGTKCDLMGRSIIGEVKEIESSRWVKKLFGSEKVENENDESGKKPAWAASEYIVSKSGLCCTPTCGPKKVVHTDNIFDMDGPDGPSNANSVADENNKVDEVIDGNAGDKINNLDKIGNKEAKVDNCDMNGSSAGKHGSSGKGVDKKRKKLLNGSFEGVMTASGKDDAKVSSSKKNRRRSFNLAKAGTRWKSSHSSSNGLGCNVNSLDVDTNEKGRGSVKTNVMGPTCSVSKDRLKKVVEQIGVVWNDMEETKLPSVAIADITTKGQ